MEKGLCRSSLLFILAVASVLFDRLPVRRRRKRLLLWGCRSVENTMKDIRALRPVMRGALIAVLTLMLVAEGAVRQEPLHLLSTVAFALAALSLLFLDRRSGAFSPVAISLGMALLLVPGVFFQAGFDFGWVSRIPSGDLRRRSSDQ